LVITNANANWESGVGFWWENKKKIKKKLKNLNFYFDMLNYCFIYSTMPTSVWADGRIIPRLLGCKNINSLPNSFIPEGSDLLGYSQKCRHCRVLLCTTRTLLRSESNVFQLHSRNNNWIDVKFNTNGSDFRQSRVLRVEHYVSSQKNKWKSSYEAEIPLYSPSLGWDAMARARRRGISRKYSE
jgi:hypothetical protein